MTASRWSVLSMAVLLALEPRTLAQSQGQFRTSTELVSVYTTVQDRTGRLVPDLRQEDFVVLDNGRPQKITFFSNEISPFSVVIMLDRSGSMVTHQEVVRDAASAFVQEMLPADKARIGSLGNRILINPPAFTSDKRALFEVLSRPAGGAGASPVWLSIDQSITALYGLEGRRVVLILSDGHDAPARNQGGTSYRDIADRVRRSGVMVYAVGFASVETQNGRQRVERPDDDLRRLAELSGGGYFEMTDTADLARLFTRVAEELHHQYWLGFEPPQRDGRVHQLEVRVQHPNMAARARQSYLAPSGK